MEGLQNALCLSSITFPVAAGWVDGGGLVVAGGLAADVVAGAVVGAVVGDFSLHAPDNMVTINMTTSKPIMRILFTDTTLLKVIFYFIPFF
jgi:hypothetical protein